MSVAESIEVRPIMTTERVRLPADTVVAWVSPLEGALWTSR